MDYRKVKKNVKPSSLGTGNSLDIVHHTMATLCSHARISIQRPTLLRQLPKYQCRGFVPSLRRGEKKNNPTEYLREFYGGMVHRKKAAIHGEISSLQRQLDTATRAGDYRTAVLCEHRIEKQRIILEEIAEFDYVGRECSTQVRVRPDQTTEERVRSTEVMTAVTVDLAFFAPGRRFVHTAFAGLGRATVVERVMATVRFVLTQVLGGVVGAVILIPPIKLLERIRRKHYEMNRNAGKIREKR